MTNFNEREKGFEAKFKHDEELRFKVVARRNKLLGLWAAGLMGLEGEAVEAYAKDVVRSDFEAPGVLRKVLDDLTGKGIEASEKLVRKQMNDLLAEAEDQIMQDT